jgi:hypothetical protein
MGNWHLSIEGTGVHHNKSPDDINVLLGEFLKLLVGKQSVERVSLTYGARQTYFGDDDGWHPPKPE